MAGIVYGIGVGPGDPELMTIKAVKCIRECDMIGIPAKDALSCTAYQIALQAVPEMADKPVIAVPVPMTTDQERLAKAYEAGCCRLTEQLQKEKKIAFLNLGDPTIYATYMVLHQKIRKAGYQAKLVSGVPSFCAVAAALDIAVASGKEQIHILPGCYDLLGAEHYEGTKILMKSAGKLEAVKEKLVQLEATEKVKVYAVSNCGMEDQAVCTRIQKLDDKAGYFTTVMIKDHAEKE